MICIAKKEHRAENKRHRVINTDGSKLQTEQHYLTEILHVEVVAIVPACAPDRPLRTLVDRYGVVAVLVHDDDEHQQPVPKALRPVQTYTNCLLCSRRHNT